MGRIANLFRWLLGGRRSDDDLIVRFANSPNAGLRERAAKYLIDRAVVLERMDHMGEALAAYDEVVKRFGREVDAGLREQVAKALLGKADVLRLHNWQQEAITACDALITAFDIRGAVVWH